MWMDMMRWDGMIWLWVAHEAKEEMAMSLRLKLMRTKDELWVMSYEIWVMGMHVWLASWSNWIVMRYVYGLLIDYQSKHNDVMHWNMKFYMMLSGL